MAARHTSHHAAEHSNEDYDHENTKDDALNEQEPLLQQKGQHLMQQSDQPQQTSSSSSSMSRQQSTHRRHPVASRQAHHSAADHTSQQLSSSSRLGHAEKRGRKEDYHEHGERGSPFGDGQTTKEHSGRKANPEEHVPSALQQDLEDQKQNSRFLAEDPWYRQQQVKPAFQHDWAA